MSDAIPAAESQDKLHSDPLPYSISGCIAATSSKPRAELVGLLASHLPQSDKKEIDDELKKTFSLEKQRLSRHAKRPDCGRRAKQLTVAEKKKLGLRKLPKSGWLYADFQPVHALWLGYMQEILRPKALQCGEQWSPDEATQMRLCRAEFHGALIKIVRSRASGQVGLQGFVVMETRNTLQILTQKNELKIIGKSDMCFSFEAHGLLITVNASHLSSKPHDRSVKKWKNRPVFDL